MAEPKEHIAATVRPESFVALGNAVHQVVSGCARRDKLPDRRGSESFETWFEGQQFVVTFSRFETGELAEVFVNAIKTTTLFDHLARDTGLLLSLALQHGAAADRLATTVSRDSEGRPQGLAGHILDIIERGVHEHCR
ncbi:MAG: hypothetical protein ACR652_17280 [Methylocystis sp.]|uniref:hypothetical protein n=1 Tax=Methylocystis sp. TaxID=1911079 RepID=UPI003DA3A784